MPDPKIAFLYAAPPPTLAELQGMVGGYIELINQWHAEGVAHQAFVDEEGKIKGYQVNVEASNYMHSRRLLNPHDFIVGDMVVLSGAACIE